MNYTIYDIESDGLLPEITLIHCLSYQKFVNHQLVECNSITGEEDIKQFFATQECIVGHNIIRYDIPAIEKVLGIKYKGKYIDTLGLSYYLYPLGKKFKHGLEAWGDRLGVEKPKIENWTNLSIDEYIHRCESDVEINARLFRKLMAYLDRLYDGQYMSIINYLNFKLECLRDQEASPITLDLANALRSKVILEKLADEKEQILAGIMPQIPYKEIPKKPYKKDGSLSSIGQKWFDLLEDLGLPEDTQCIYEKGNPGSSDQLKKWLFTIGWIPETFKLSKATNLEVEQISLPFGGGICPSVKKLYEVEPNLQELEGLYVLRHRIGILKSFIECSKKGKFYADAHGFTNTLRMQHSRPIVNLPGGAKPYAKEIRQCITIPNEEWVMIGSDISGLEDNTKQHYIFNYDPDYVTEMRVPGFDAHLDIGRLGGLITEEEEKFYKWYEKNR